MNMYIPPDPKVNMQINQAWEDLIQMTKTSDFLSVQKPA